MHDKTIFITGGNAGIGLATARLFSREGANVAIFSRRAEQNAEAQKVIEAEGGKCIEFAGDVTNAEDIHKAVTETERHFGGLHFAFNNAGAEQVPTPLTEQTEEHYSRIMDTNVKGTWLCMKEEIPLIKKSGGGCIVNNSSVSGLAGMARVPLYCAAKHAVIGMTKSVALEYAKEGVRVNAICPGAVYTDLYRRFTKHNPGVERAIEGLFPMGRAGKPEEIASGVLYLCRDATWTTGHSLVVDGGFMAP